MASLMLWICPYIFISTPIESSSGFSFCTFLPFSFVILGSERESEGFPFYTFLFCYSGVRERERERARGFLYVPFFLSIHREYWIIFRSIDWESVWKGGEVWFCWHIDIVVKCSRSKLSNNLAWYNIDNLETLITSGFIAPVELFLHSK